MLPVQDNATAWDGSTVTSGLAQFPDDGHYAVYNNKTAQGYYRDYLKTLLDGEPVLDE